MEVARSAAVPQLRCMSLLLTFRVRIQAAAVRLKAYLLVNIDVTRQRLREVGWPLEPEQDPWPPGGYLRLVNALPLASVSGIHKVL